MHELEEIKDEFGNIRFDLGIHMKITEYSDSAFGGWKERTGLISAFNIVNFTEIMAIEGQTQVKLKWKD